MDEPLLRDIIDLPFWDGTPGRYPSVTLRMDFRAPEITGTFLFHCHILEHEDAGMMDRWKSGNNADRMSLTGGTDMVLLAMVLPALLSASLFAADIQPNGKFEVHEWGTFTSIAGPDGRRTNGSPSAVLRPSLLRASIPGWVQGESCGKVRMETPVIYFYSPHG